MVKYLFITLISLTFFYSCNSKKDEFTSEVSVLKLDKKKFPKLKKIILTGDDNIKYQTVNIDSNYLIRSVESYKDGTHRKNHRNSWISFDADGNLEDLQKCFFYQANFIESVDGKYYLDIYFPTSFFIKEKKYLVTSQRFTNGYEGVNYDTLEFDNKNFAYFEVKNIKNGRNDIKFILLVDEIVKNPNQINRHILYGNYRTQILKK